jgi:hypothetical protein
MTRIHLAGIAVVLVTAAFTATARAQAPTSPPFATTKVEGTEDVYIFRYAGHQSMFMSPIADLVYFAGGHTCSVPPL